MTEQQGDYITEANDMLGKGYEADQQIIDDSDLRKYRIELPNLYDDADLDPYEFRLLAHYKRVGTCTEGTRTTGIKCHMSPAQVSEKRKSLADKKFIVMKEVPLKDNQFSYSITVIDRWAENFKKYSTRSLSKHPRSLSEHPVHSVKQRINHIKKEPVKNIAATPKANTYPALVVFRSVTKRYPHEANWQQVIDAFEKTQTRLGRDVTKEDLLPFFTFWTGKGYNPYGLGWLDWAVMGKTPENGKVAQGYQKQSNIEKTKNAINEFLGMFVEQEIIDVESN